nr:putative ribonuclease H-like domain-containing protein [Tanacetum cinerariifolium]
GHSYKHIEDQGYFNSGCSWHMARNISYLTDFKEFDGGYVAYRGGAKDGKITGKGTIRTADESYVLLKVPRKNNMYNVDMKNIVPKKDLTCLVAKATYDESMLWHKRLGHINFKNINKLVKHNLVRGLPSKCFENEQTYVACLKGKQQKVSFKSKIQNFISQPLFMLHMDLFGPTSVFYLSNKALKDPTSFILNHLGKFSGKSDEGFFVGYSTDSKGFRVYNTRTRKVQTLMILQEKEQVLMQIQMVTIRIMMVQNTKSEIDNQERPNDKDSTKDINTVGPSINTASSNINIASPAVNTVRLSDDFFGADNDIRSLDEVELDIRNIFTTLPVPTTPNTRINKDHSLDNMDVKSAFMYGRIEKEVYVCQPPGFKDPDYPDKVYKVEKALYGLHQAPRAWYETLAKYLLDNGFRRGKIDQTLFIKRQKEDILLVQVYVDDIIFGSTKKELCAEFKFWRTASVRTLDNGEILNATVDGHDNTITEASVKIHLKLADADGVSTLPTTMHDGLGRAITTASSLGAEQGNGNITKTQTKATPSGPSSPRTSSMGGPGCHFTMGDSPVQAWPERLSNLPNESPLGEDKVTHLENELISTKSIYNKALITLTKRVKKLEKKLKHKRRRAVIDSLEEEAANLDHEDSPKQGRRIEEINKDENKIKKKEMMQISLVEEITQRFYEEEQAQILRDEEMLEKERESLSIKERSRLLAEFIDKRKKMLAAKKADEKQNKPPTQAQQRTYMSNYLKNIGGYTLKQLKQYSFKEIKMLFDNTMENIRRFVPMESEGQEAAHFKGGEGSSKEGESLKRSAKEELGQEQSLKKRLLNKKML